MLCRCLLDRRTRPQGSYPFTRPATSLVHCRSSIRTVNHSANAHPTSALLKNLSKEQAHRNERSSTKRTADPVAGPTPSMNTCIKILDGLCNVDVAAHYLRSLSRRSLDFLISDAMMTVTRCLQIVGSPNPLSLAHCGPSASAG